MGWRIEDKQVSNLEEVVEGKTGTEKTPSVLVLFEMDSEAIGLSVVKVVYVGHTDQGPHTRLAWHVRRGTDLGVYLTERRKHWKNSYLVCMLQIGGRLVQAHKFFCETLNPQFHNPYRPVGQIMDEEVMDQSGNVVLRAKAL